MVINRIKMKCQECNLVFKLASLFTTLMMRVRGKGSNFFVCLLFTRQYDPIKYIISSFSQRGNYSSERLSHLPKAAQLMSCRGRVGT